MLANEISSVYWGSNNLLHVVRIAKYLNVDINEIVKY